MNRGEKVTLNLRGSLPARIKRELREDEELTFSVTARVDREGFNVETGESFVDLRIVSAEAPA